MASKNLNVVALNAAFWRFVRVIVPQIPTVIALATNKLPDWAVLILVFLGAGLTALDKFAREKGWY